MADIKELIGKIMQKLAAREPLKPEEMDIPAAKENPVEKIYREEPILRTAAQAALQLPSRYREMRKIAGRYGASPRSESQLFYEQGKFVEDFEDEYTYHGEFFRYYPTYQAMNDQQLRGYFSWRTKVRRGQVEFTSLSFVFVYLYELLNGIGVPSPQAGFDALRNFWRIYRRYDSKIDFYTRQWLRDYVVYYGLDRSLLGETEEARFDEALGVLLRHGSHTEDEVFSALNALSSYHLEDSGFCRRYPQDVQAVACGVFARLAEYYEKNRKSTLCEKLFGKVVSAPYTMFQSAVFYDAKKYADYEYSVSEMCEFHCKNGVWSCKTLLGRRERSKELGAILKAVDRAMRQQYEYKPLLREETTTKLLQGIIQKEMDALQARKKEEERRKITIDVSKLQGIRRAADTTREKLMVDEPEEAAPAAPKQEAVFPAEQAQKTAEAEPTVSTVELDATERRFLQCLLAGEDYRPLLREAGIMLSVLVDAVNEKLYDSFADTVILLEDDTPELLEDYAQELKGMLDDENTETNRIGSD